MTKTEANKKCEYCNDTGYYGDNGPGIVGNGEYHPCDECDADPSKCKCQTWARKFTAEELNQPPTHHPNCDKGASND